MPNLALMTGMLEGTNQGAPAFTRARLQNQYLQQVMQQAQQKTQQEQQQQQMLKMLGTALSSNPGMLDSMGGGGGSGAGGGTQGPLAIPPPPGPPPQSPPPGQSSPPMMHPGQAQPPMQAPAQAQSYGAGAPGAPPPVQSQGWQPLPQGGGGGSPGGPPPSAPGMPPQLGAPPSGAPPDASGGVREPPRRDISSIIKSLKSSGIPPEQMFQALDALQPILNSQDKNELVAYKAQVTAESAANRVYEQTLRDEMAHMDRQMNDATRQRGQNITLNLGERGLDIKERAATDKRADGSFSDPSERESAGAQVASGMPISQVVPGFGVAAVKKREEARKEAIKQIQDENPGWSAIQAGNELASRTIDYTAGKKSVGQLTTMQGATRQAVDQLDFNVKKVTSAMDKLASSDLSPVINAIARGAEKWSGDPAYSELFYYMFAAGQESARILSGGQASIAQLHQGAAEEAQKWADANMTTPKAWKEGVAPAMLAEGKERLKTYERAITAQRDKRNEAAGTRNPGEGGMGPPQAGSIEDGYRFKGGDAHDPKNWEKVQ